MCPATIVSANLIPVAAPWHGMPPAFQKFSRAAANPVVAPPVVPLAGMPFVNWERPVTIAPQTAVHVGGVKWDLAVKSCWSLVAPPTPTATVVSVTWMYFVAKAPGMVCARKPPWPFARLSATVGTLRS